MSQMASSVPDMFTNKFLFREQSDRDKAMKEVEVLPGLDHAAIVRYYHSWIECGLDAKK